MLRPLNRKGCQRGGKPAVYAQIIENWYGEIPCSIDEKYRKEYAPILAGTYSLRNGEVCAACGSVYRCLMMYRQMYELACDKTESEKNESKSSEYSAEIYNVGGGICESPHNSLRYRCEYHSGKSKSGYCQSCGKTSPVRQPFLHAAYAGGIAQSGAQTAKTGIGEADELYGRRGECSSEYHACGEKLYAKKTGGTRSVTIVEYTAEETANDKSGEHI